MYDTATDLLDAQRATSDVLQAILAGVSQEQAQMARGGDENWSVVEVVCHLRDAEGYALSRTVAMRDQDHPLLASYDQDAVARDGNYAAQDLRTVADQFLAVRAERLAALEALTPEQWKRTGRHAEVGDITIESHTLHIVSHDLVHLAQIARQLRG